MPYVDLNVGATATSKTSRTAARTVAAELPSISRNKGGLGLKIGNTILQAIKGTGIGTAITSILTPTTVADSTWGVSQYTQQQQYLNKSIKTSVSTISAKDEVSEIPKYTALHGYDVQDVETSNISTVRLPSVGAVEAPIVMDESIPLSGAYYEDDIIRRAKTGSTTTTISPISRIVEEAIDDEKATGVVIATKPRQGANGQILLGVNGMPTYEDATKGTQGVITPAKDLVIQVPKFETETKLEIDKSGVMTISRSVLRTDRSNKKQKKDKKGRAGKAYRIALRVINNTVGHEMFDLWMAFIDNLKTPEEEGKSHKWMFRKAFAPVYDPVEERWSYKPVTAKAAIEGFNDGTLELDVAGFMRDVAQNQIEDLVIAKLSQGADRWRAQQGRVVGVGFGEAIGYAPDVGRLEEGQRTEYFDPDEFIRRQVPNVEFSAKFRM
jgi:hypothetical protein